MSRGPRTPVDLPATARRLADRSELWAPLVDFDPTTRYYARLAAGAGYEAWLLTWLPGQGTDWHDHGDSAGAFVVLQGALTEQTASGGGADDVRRASERSARLIPGDERSFGRRYVHRVTNADLDPAVSLHVYAPRLTEMTTYALVGDRLHRDDRQRAGVSW